MAVTILPAQTEAEIFHKILFFRETGSGRGGGLNMLEVCSSTGGISVRTFQDLQNAELCTISYCQMQLLCKVA